jgi:hypothetical protein
MLLRAGYIICLMEACNVTLRQSKFYYWAKGHMIMSIPTVAFLLRWRLNNGLALRKVLPILF